MEQLLVFTNSKGNNVTSSIIISEIFNKNHAHVLRDIRELDCSNSFRESNFGELFIIRDLPNGGKKEEPYFEITKDGFSFLVMGYTGKKAAEFKEKFIIEFNKRDTLLKDDDYILSRALEISGQRMKLLESQLNIKNHQLKEMQETQSIQAPKADYYDEVLQGDGLISITLIAKDLGMSAQGLNKLLHQHEIIYKHRKTWILYSKYQDKGYTHSRTFTHKNKQGKDVSEQYTYWTELGRKHVIEFVTKLKEKGRLTL